LSKSEKSTRKALNKIEALPLESEEGRARLSEMLPESGAVTRIREAINALPMLRQSELAKLVDEIGRHAASLGDLHAQLLDFQQRRYGDEKE
jgi:hypothetical protein